VYDIFVMEIMSDTDRNPTGVVGDLYAGDIEHRGVERYFDKAFNLGGRLA